MPVRLGAYNGAHPTFKASNLQNLERSGQATDSQKAVATPREFELGSVSWFLVWVGLESGVVSGLGRSGRALAEFVLALNRQNYLHWTRTGILFSHFDPVSLSCSV